MFSFTAVFFSPVWLQCSPQKNQQRPERGSIIGFPCGASLNITPGEQRNMELHLICQWGSRDCIIWLWLFLPPSTWAMVWKTCSDTDWGCSRLWICYSAQKASGERAGCVFSSGLCWKDISGMSLVVSFTPAVDLSWCSCGCSQIAVAIREGFYFFFMYQTLGKHLTDYQLFHFVRHNSFWQFSHWAFFFLAVIVAFLPSHLFMALLIHNTFM